MARSATRAANSARIAAEAADATAEAADAVALAAAQTVETAKRAAARAREAAGDARAAMGDADTESTGRTQAFTDSETARDTARQHYQTSVEDKRGVADSLRRPPGAELHVGDKT